MGSLSLVDDNVLLLVLDHLDAQTLLDLNATSSQNLARLSTSEASGFSSLVQRWANGRLGPAATRDAVKAGTAFFMGEAAQAEVTSLSPSASVRHRGVDPTALGNIALLRALSGDMQSQVLELAAALAFKGKKAPQFCTQASAGDAKPFLEALFRWEVSRVAETKRCVRDDKAIAPLASEVVGDAALACLVKPEYSILEAAAKAVINTECLLDELVEQGTLGPVGGRMPYEQVARYRSAAEFLRGRLDRKKCPSDKNRTALDTALAELDGTIMSYIREGYELACPIISGGFSSSAAVPYKHWWVFAGRAASQGWVSLDGWCGAT
eukprot:TRINITY_DN16946_c0_g1_i1.p1 TRINITY_DN16946_c0_g1~~TRINITY_DN16946_c0_g1_i1.p1  ORF type:complete len:324 (+),score=42.10 TRINITY_DN16946_c0_g1_i1:194-1165(+)